MMFHLDDSANIITENLLWAGHNPLPELGMYREGRKSPALTVAAAEATGTQVTPTKRTVCWNTRVMYDHHQALWTPYHAQELPHCILTEALSGCYFHDRYFPENGEA